MRASHRAINLDNEKAHYEFCELPDCAFLSDRGKCNKLTVNGCIGSCCSFMQTKLEVNKIHERWCKRLSGMDESTQISISKKYYGGSMPWRNDDYHKVIRINGGEINVSN